MKFDKRFPVQIGVTLVVGLLLGAVPAARAGGDTLTAVVIGALLSTANVLAGFFAIEYAFDKSHETFLKAIVGGMGVRMVLMLGIIVVLIRVASVQAVALVVSVLAFYVVFLVFELLYIQRRISRHQLMKQR